MLRSSSSKRVRGFAWSFQPALVTCQSDIVEPEGAGGRVLDHQNNTYGIRRRGVVASHRNPASAGSEAGADVRSRLRPARVVADQADGAAAATRPSPSAEAVGLSRGHWEGLRGTLPDRRGCDRE